jgi:hypothetical protein
MKCDPEATSAWQSLCDAWVKEDWPRLEAQGTLLTQMLQDGRIPNIAGLVDNSIGLNQVLANAGVPFIMERFKRHSI